MREKADEFLAVLNCVVAEVIEWEGEYSVRAKIHTVIAI